MLRSPYRGGLRRPSRQPSTCERRVVLQKFVEQRRFRNRRQGGARRYTRPQLRTSRSERLVRFGRYQQTEDLGSERDDRRADRLF